jgi:DNA polymerase-1
VVFGFLYGQGKDSFVNYVSKNYGLEISAVEAGILKDKFFGAFPKLKNWMEQPYRDGGDWAEFVRLVNHNIQGTAAKGLKYAIVMLADRLKKHNAHIVNIVYDELVVECNIFDVSTVRDLMAKYMVEGMQLALSGRGLPVKIDVAVKMLEAWEHDAEMQERMFPIE